MTYALALSTNGADASRSDSERNVPHLRFLRIGMDAAQPQREAPKTFAVAHHKWSKLQFGAVSNDLEQFS